MRRPPRPQSTWANRSATRRATGACHVFSQIPGSRYQYRKALPRDRIESRSAGRTLRGDPLALKSRIVSSTVGPSQAPPDMPWLWKANFHSSPAVPPPSPPTRPSPRLRLVRIAFCDRALRNAMRGKKNRQFRACLSTKPAPTRRAISRRKPRSAVDGRARTRRSPARTARRLPHSARLTIEANAGARVLRGQADRDGALIAVGHHLLHHVGINGFQLRMPT